MRLPSPRMYGMPHPNANGNNSAVLSPLSPLAVPLSPRGPSERLASSVRMPTSRLSTTYAGSRVGSAAASSDLAFPRPDEAIGAELAGAGQQPYARSAFRHPG